MFYRLLPIWFYSISMVTLISVTGIHAENEPNRLTTNKAPDFHCKWSPDGEWIVFTSLRSGEAKLHIIPDSGGEAFLLESGLSGDHHTGWSPDSKYIVFDARAAEGQPPRLWLMTVNGGDVKPLLPDIYPAFQPALSPDGEWVAFCTYRSGNGDIWKAKLNGDSLTQLTRDPHNDHHPQWSPDGKSIVFASDRNGNFDVWIMNADGTQERQITTAPELDDQAVISPDGKLIAFMSERTGKRDIWLKPIGIGVAKRCTEEGENGWPSFSPDSKHLVWSSKRDGQVDLYVGKITDD